MERQSDDRRRVLAAHYADEPTPGSEDRVWRALSERLDAPLSDAAAAAATPIAASKLAWLSGTSLKLAVLGVAAGALLVGSLVWDARSVPAPQPARPVQPHASEGTERTQPVTRVGESATTEFESARPASSTLQAESALVAAAQKALARGKPADALTALTEHADQFPDGMLAQERDGLRAVALCEMNSHMARSARREFMKKWPRSSLLLRVNLACDRGRPDL
jgi:hypothetical protein